MKFSFHFYVLIVSYVVESIIRRRTLAAFFSRCPAFQPPPNPDGGPSVPAVDLESMPMRGRPVNN